MNKVLVLGAFDRYNYGDLLFPLIIEQQLKTYNPNIEFEYFGLVKSDLSEVGGKKTLDILSFYKECNNVNARVNVIIAGGESINATWNGLLSSISGSFAVVNKYHRQLTRFINLNRIARFILKGQTNLPLIFAKEDFKGVDHVILNSLGGSSINDQIFSKFAVLEGKLKKADYFAVRDKKTYDVMANRGIPVNLFPDSAIIMSKFFPLSKLEELVAPEILSYVKQNKKKYIYFQSNKGSAINKETLIAEKLSEIARKHDLKIVLCPIGVALGHEDHIPLLKIKEQLDVPVNFFEKVTIWDIMYLIGSSYAYIGTSLHGAITAMSFDVPYIGVRIKKLDSYINTWGVESLKGVVEFDAMPKRFDVLTQVPESELVASREHQFKQIEKSFDNIKKMILASA